MRSLARVLAVTAVLAAAAAVGSVGTCGPTPAPKPPLADKVRAHDRAAVVDSMQLAEIRRRDSLAAAEQAATVARAERAERTAAAHRRRADSLAAEARLATSLADSARGWEVAYVERTKEADSLRTANRELRTALDTADRRIVRLLRADSLHVAGRARTEQLLRDALAEAAKGEQCRIVGPVPCPSRRTVAVAAIVGGVALGSGAAEPIADAVGSMIGRIF